MRERPILMTTESVKACSQCGVSKSISEFYSGRADCKECIKKRNAKYYMENKDRYHQRRAIYRQSNREYYRQKERERYATLRAGVLIAYGSKCSCCGETEPLFLELDHIKNNGKGIAGKALYQQAKTEGFPRDKYQLLCANCNQGKKRNGGICPHNLRNGQ